MNESIPLSVYRKAMNDILYWVFSNVDESRFPKTRSIYGADGRTADYGTIKKVSLERGSCQGDDGLLAEATECLIFDNDDDLSFLPNYVTLDSGEKLYKSEYVDMANRVSAYEVLKGESPRIVYRTTQQVNKTFDYFVSKSGKVYSIDEALGRILDNGYEYYFNSAFDNITAIDRMFNGSGVNCTDAAQVFYRIGQALGYEVQFVHVMCSGGDGHIRLRLKHDINTGGEWIDRDPAAVLDGECVECIWCMNGTVIAYDPAWIFTDLDQ